MSINPTTIEMIKIIAKALGDLNDNAVFVGGATIPFYLPDSFSSQARPTEDIDIVMEVVGRSQNSINEERLRAKGFNHDTSLGAPICRWVYRDYKVDIMSSDISAFGFTNKWYKEGIERSIEAVSSPVKVKIFNLPYFIASKLEAFKDRGNRDYRASSDMEDIISVLEVAHREIFEEVRNQCSSELVEYLRVEFKRLLATPDFIDALPGAIFNRGSETLAIQGIKERMEKF
jgi:predicted nucleotidyltransferase